jgi:hypothetical protein
VGVQLRADVQFSRANRGKQHWMSWIGLMRLDCRLSLRERAFFRGAKDDHASN